MWLHLCLPSRRMYWSLYNLTWEPVLAEKLDPCIGGKVEMFRLVWWCNWDWLAVFCRLTSNFCFCSIPDDSVCKVTWWVEISHYFSIHMHCCFVHSALARFQHCIMGSLLYIQVMLLDPLSTINQKHQKHLCWLTRFRTKQKSCGTTCHMTEYQQMLSLCDVLSAVYVPTNIGLYCQIQYVCNLIL